MQQLLFIDLFIGLFESALHVSGNKLTHLQELFWLYIQLWYNAPILLPTSDKVEMELVIAYTIVLMMHGVTNIKKKKSKVWHQKSTERWKLNISPNWIRQPNCLGKYMIEMIVKIKSGINNNCQKYDGFRVITHDPHNLYSKLSK